MGRYRARAALSIILTVAILANTGCASRATGVMKPVAETAPQAGKVDMLVATTRAPSGDPGTLFSGERGNDLAIDAVTVSIPPDTVRKPGTVQWPTRLPPNPAKDFATLKVEPITAEPDLHAWLKNHGGEKRRLMVFVHGFNNTYEDSVFRFAQIVHDSKANVTPVVFTWPSRASIFDYAYDRESTNYSRDALEEMMQKGASDPAVGEITIMAHSMGTWLVMESLRQMAIRNGRVSPKISQVILASPDLDVDVFSQQMRALGDKHPKFTIFVSGDDKALSLSRTISGNVDRLGQVNPAAEPYRSAFAEAGITVYDLTKLSTEDRLGHTKFADSPEVVQLIGERLVGGQTITDSRVGLGDGLGVIALGTTSIVGDVASIAVRAPISVFDPNSDPIFRKDKKRKLWLSDLEKPKTKEKAKPKS